MTDLVHDRLRRATVGDIDRLARMDAYVQKLHCDAHPEIWKKPNLVESVVFFDRHFKEANGVIMVSQDENGLAVGYVLVHLTEKPESSHKPARRISDLEQLAVDPAYQGSDRGRELLDWVDDYARDNACDLIELSVWQFNARAISIYERHGFTGMSSKMMKPLGWNDNDDRQHAGLGDN